MANRDDKKLTPSDLDPIMAMHSDLKETLRRGMSTLQEEMRELNLTQVVLAKDIEHIKTSQGKHDNELNVIRSTQLSCPSATGFTGTMRRIARLERFKDQVFQAGVLSTSELPTPPYSLPAVQVTQTANNTETKESSKFEPKISDKLIRASLLLLLGAAMGGALLAAAMFIN